MTIPINLTSDRDCKTFFRKITIRWCLVQTMDQQFGLAVLDQVDDQLAKEGVLPCEPGAGITRGIVLVERLVHEACARIGGQQLAHAPGDFLVVVGRESLHHDAHGPDEIGRAHV